MAMNLGNGSGALTDGAANPLDGSRAHVANGEDSGNAGLQRQEPPVFLCRPQIGAGPDKSIVIERHVAIAQPLCFRIRAHEEEDVVDRMRLLGTFV